MKAAPIHFGIDVIVPQIIDFGMLRLPNEACGIVVPDWDKPADDWVIELENLAPTPETMYEIDTSVITGLLKDPETWSDVLVWHTHPTGAVGPSRRDVANKLEGLRYLVVALPRGEATLF